MSSSTSTSAPALFDGRPVTEIVVPVDLGPHRQRGLNLAARYGHRWQVPVQILHTRLPSETDAPGSLDAIVDAFRGYHPDLVVEGADITAEGVAAGLARVTSGRSLVILASDEASRWLKSPSTAEEIVQASESLILVCGPGCEDPPADTGVLVALDGSDRAEEAIAPARAVAEAHGTRLWLVTAVPRAVAATVAAMRASGEPASESAYLRSLADRLESEGVDVRWEVVQDDDPVAGVIAAASRLGVSMLVATTHGETGVARRLFGSVSMGLAQLASVPVLIVKSHLEPAAALPGSPNP
ncbi:MAG: universal stress protein [Acidimicrobiales bacterium]